GARSRRLGPMHPRTPALPLRRATPWSRRQWPGLPRRLRDAGQGAGVTAGPDQPTGLPPLLADVADRTRGFLPDDEAAALRAAAAGAVPGVWLEIGTYCGKSTVHLGAVARARGAALVTVDHHHG